MTRVTDSTDVTKRAIRSGPETGEAGPGGQWLRSFARPELWAAAGYDASHHDFAWQHRELARLTGLSEHTIRRKLGEWGLKRKKELP